MNGITVSEKKIVSVSDSNGVQLNIGDPILVRSRGEDIVCRFMGIREGYFTTETLEDKVENKYRTRSIEKCVRISGIREWPETTIVREEEKED